VNLSMVIDIPAMIVPDQLAVIADDHEETYAALKEASGRWAGLLSSLGVGSGDRVAVFATNRPATLHALFGVLTLGGTVVPMNYRARGEEVAYLLRDSGAKLIVTEDRYLDVITGVGMPREQVLTLDEGETKAEGFDPVEDAAEVDDAAVGILLYTSGTTSLPKGVMLTHNGFSTYVLANGEAADGEEHGTTLLAAPLYHVAGLTALTQALFTGRRVVLLPQFEAGAWLDAVARHRVTHAFVVPSMLALLLRHPNFDTADLSSLEMLTYGAAPMPAAVLREAVDRFPRNVSFSGAYGQTETNSTVAVLGPDDHRMEGTPEEIEAKRRRLASVGKPLPDVEVRIVDPLGTPVGANQTGEVQLRTARAMAGYWGARSADTRVTIDEEGWVHTGDLGYLDDDGYLYLTGRASDLIIRGGENISPGEIEAVLIQHPDVQEAVAFGVPDDQWGERVFAAVVLKPGATVTGDQLVELCKAQLAGSKRPEMVFIVEDFPRTATGKVLRRSMASQFVAGQEISAPR